MKTKTFQKVGDLLAREHKISIQEGNSWCCNIKYRTVFYINEDIHELPEEHILGLLLHEIAHIHYTSDVAYPKINIELMKTTVNALEDLAIEHIIGKDYPNAGEILESTTQEVLDQLIKILPKLKISNHEKALLYASAKFQGRGYSTNIAKYEIVGQEIAEIIEKNKKEILNRKETKDLLPIAKKIVNILIERLGQLPEEEKRKINQNTNQETTGNVNQEENENELSRRKLLRMIGKNPGSIKASITNTNIKYIAKIIEQSNIVGKRIRTVLKRNNAMEFGGRYSKGKILPKRLIRMKILKDRKAFAKRIIKNNKSYSFAITCDVSGSMFGVGGKIDPISNAMSSMCMVAEALRVAKIPRSLSIFGGEAIVLTETTKNKIEWNEITNEKKIRNAGQGCTYIEKGMEKCIEQLEKTKTEKKIMIVLTDGEAYEDDVDQMYKTAKKQGIECIGITLKNRNDKNAGVLERVFGEKNNINVTNTEKVGEAFINILKQTIKISENNEKYR